MSRIRNVMLVAPKSTGGNFEYVAIPRQGPLYISGALKQWQGEFLYDREIWLEDRNGKIDPEKDLDNVGLLMVTALINEAPRAYEITRKARELHPDMGIIGGGPHMSPLAEEAVRYGKVDVVVIREGEDVVGPLSDVMLKYRGNDRIAQLYKIPGIAFLDGDRFVHTERHGVIASDFVQIPDFDAMKDLTPQNPLAAGVIETVRGCTEKCTYCQVIQQFLGYRMVSRQTELLRLAQIRKLAEDGKIYTTKNGRFSVFISDDLHPPPLRATKFRDERVARLKAWKGYTEGMWMICQTRAEIGQDPELGRAMREAGIEMLYVGVESSSAENLKIVRKRQDPTQVHRDLVTLNELGFIVAAMTIIGLPYDTEAAIMEMADWAKTISRYQTANLLTPLPATVNWNLPPLDEDGFPLPEGKMRPYHLYTGRQLVFEDKRWGMQESRDLYAKYTSRLRPVDNMYERIFRIFKSKAYHQTRERQRQERPVTLSSRLATDLVDFRVRQWEESLSSTFTQVRDSLVSSLGEMAASLSTRSGELRSSLATKLDDLQETISTRMEEINGTLSSRMADLKSSLSSTTEELRDSLASTSDDIGKALAPKVGELRVSVALRLADMKETVASRVGEAGESLSSRITELTDSVSARLNELGEAIATSVHDFKDRVDAVAAPRQPGVSTNR